MSSWAPEWKPILVIVSGGLFIALGSLKITDLAIYVLYINIFINPIDVLLNFTEQFQKGFAGFKRFIEVLETRPEIVDKGGKNDCLSRAVRRGGKQPYVLFCRDFMM